MPDKQNDQPREHWGSRIGLILAVAGNAVGLGNFLRFPTQAAANGGGAFMVPYFVAFFLLGIPLMWIEWGLGRFGGTIGHGTMPGIYNRIWKNKIAKYLGVLGVLLPLFIVIYYNYIESWTGAYSYFSLNGQYAATVPAGEVESGKDLLAKHKAEMARFLKEFQGIRQTVRVKKDTPEEKLIGIRAMVEPASVSPDLLYNPETHGKWDENNPSLDPGKCPYQTVALKGKYFSNSSTAYFFFLITFTANMFFLYKGLSAGIEQLGKIGMPILFGFGVILAFRVATLGRPEGSPWSVADGFNFLWTPDFSQLSNSAVWLAAAGQIFFTLSLGTGAIQVYASYLSHKDDIVLSGLATGATNEFAEVVLGGTVAIPAAVAFFGPEMTSAIAQGGSFDLGFQSLPMIFSKTTLGWFFGAIWFALLFIAGITSSVALAMPGISFLKDEMKFSHEKAVAFIGAIIFVAAHGVILFFDRGVLDEMDYWAGTFFLVVFALKETLIFIWVYGPEQAWKEMHKGADIKIPRIFGFIMKYITPVYLSLILVAWSIQNGWSTLVMQGVPLANQPFVWGTRFFMLFLVGVFMYLIWKRFGEPEEESIYVPGALWGFPMLVLVASYPGLFSIGTNALLMIVMSWTIVIGLAAFSIYKVLTVPAKKHADFPNEAAG